MEAGKTVRVAVLSFAHGHAYGYAGVLTRLPDVELVAIADEDEARGEQPEADGPQHTGLHRTRHLGDDVGRRVGVHDHERPVAWLGTPGQRLLTGAGGLQDRGGVGADSVFNLRIPDERYALGPCRRRENRAEGSQQATEGENETSQAQRQILP